MPPPLFRRSGDSRATAPEPRAGARGLLRHVGSAARPPPRTAPPDMSAPSTLPAGGEEGLEASRPPAANSSRAPTEEKEAAGAVGAAGPAGPAGARGRRA